VKFWQALLGFEKPPNQSMIKQKSFSMALEKEALERDYHRHLIHGLKVPEAELHSVAELVEYAGKRPNLVDWFLKMQRLEPWLMEAGVPRFASLARDACHRVGVPEEDRLALFLALCRGEKSHGDATEAALWQSPVVPSPAKSRSKRQPLTEAVILEYHKVTSGDGGQRYAPLGAHRYGDLEKVKTLLENYPDLVFDTSYYNNVHNGETSNYDDLPRFYYAGGTPLHWAAGVDYEIIARLLLAKGANVNAKNLNGVTPLHLAAKGGHNAIAELLLVNNAKVNAKTKSGNTPLHEAADLVNQRSDTVALLVAYNANVNAKNHSGNTPLHLAAFWGHYDLARLLVKHNARIDRRNKFGSTPRQMALERVRGHARGTYWTNNDHRSVAEYLSTLEHHTGAWRARFT